MVLAGGCAGRALVRLGGGSVKALLVLLLMGLTAFLVTSGPLAFVTRALLEVGSVRLGTPTGGLDALLAGAGLGATPARLLATLLLLAPLLAFCLADPKLRRSRADLATGAALGAVVAFGWLATATLGDAAAPSSLTFVGPAGGTLLWLMAGDGQLPASVPRRSWAPFSARPPRPPPRANSASRRSRRPTTPSATRSAAPSWGSAVPSPSAARSARA